MRIIRKEFCEVFRTMFEIDSIYTSLKPLGRGSYGFVCSSTNTATKERVAIKKVIDVFENQMDAVRTLRELIVLRCIKHENVVAIKDVMLPTDTKRFNEVYMVYELMDSDLERIIKSPQPLLNEHCQYFLFQLLSGLKYLHSANVLHRDLKPGNLLVNKDCTLKICDFGLARSNRQDGELMTEYVVTRWYRAPELLLACDNYGYSIDMWSAGCILAELLGRKPLFPGTDSLNQLKVIMSVVGAQPETNLEFIDNPRAKSFIDSLNESSPETDQFSSLFPQADPLAVDLMTKMLEFDPSKRITVTEALCHPYMSSFYDPTCHPDAKIRVNLDNIHESIGEPIIREMVLREILFYHPEGVNAV